MILRRAPLHVVNVSQIRWDEGVVQRALSPSGHFMHFMLHIERRFNPVSSPIIGFHLSGIVDEINNVALALALGITRAKTVDLHQSLDP